MESGVCVCKGEQEGVKWRVVIDIKPLPVPGRLHQTSPPRSGLADRIAADREGGILYITITFLHHCQ